MKEIENKLNSMTGYTTVLVYDQPSNRYQCAVAEVDSNIIDEILEADSVRMVNPIEESAALEVMTDNFDEDIYSSEDSKMIIAKKGDTTIYMICYE